MLQNKLTDIDLAAPILYNVIFSYLYNPFKKTFEILIIELVAITIA